MSPFVPAENWTSPRRADFRRLNATLDCAVDDRAPPRMIEGITALRVWEAAMQKPKAASSKQVAPDRARKGQTIPREYAGNWVAWSADGRKIVAVADSFRACEQAAEHAGFRADQVAIDRVPVSRQRLTGSGM